MKPICFMIMPYGVKPTLQVAGGTAPAEVNFDRLWAAAFRPAIEQLGYEPVRADQDLGALIINEMIERLALSDLVLADVSIGNANVYYEIGVRHAASREACVMVGASWAQPLFDLNQMRQLRFPLPATVIDDATAEDIIRILVAQVPALARGLSPVFQAIPHYPNVAAARRSALSFRSDLESLSAFQAEVIAAREAPAGERQARALALRDRTLGGGGPVQKAVALELLYLLRDCADWQTTLAHIDALPAELQTLPVVQEQRALALSKDGDHLAAIGALKELIRVAGDSSERRGLLGGRYKKLWRNETDIAQKRQYLDFAIREYDAGMHLDLNDYYPSCNLPLLYQARQRKGDGERAQTAAAITMIACERARARNACDEWLNPTLLGAAFQAGDVEKARALADQVRLDGPAAWKLDTTLNDLRATIALQIDAHKGAELMQIVDELQALLPS